MCLHQAVIKVYKLLLQYGIDMLRSVPLVPRLYEEELAGHPVRFSGEDGHAVQAGITQAILETDGDVRVEVPQLSLGVPLRKEARKALAQGGGGPRGHAVKVQLHPLVYFWAHICNSFKLAAGDYSGCPRETHQGYRGQRTTFTADKIYGLFCNRSVTFGTFWVKLRKD